MITLGNFGKKEKARSLKQIFADIDTLVTEIATNGATLEDIIAAPTGLQYELRSGVMLAVVSKRLRLAVPGNYVHPDPVKFSAQRGVETRGKKS